MLGNASFTKGEKVTIIAGTFTAFTGTVEKVDEIRRRLKVKVSVFIKEISVDLSFSEVQKLSFTERK